MTADLNEVMRFLTFLEPKADLSTRFCWQVHQPAVAVPTQFANVVSKSFAYHRTWALNEDAGGGVSAWGRLQEQNAAGRSIFVTINETDGNGRKASNMLRVRAVFVDLDGSPVQPVYDAPYRPHLVVQTSPGKYHAYWKVDKLALSHFGPVQAALAALFAGDPTVIDLSRVMRVPGFWHLKKEPFMSRIEMDERERPAFGAKDFREWLGVTDTGRSIPRSAAPVSTSDPATLEVTSLLLRHDMYVRPDKDGKHIVVCPWAHKHTDPQQNEAAYWEPSPRNGGKGAFKCLHAHCMHLTIGNLWAFVQGVQKLEAQQNVG